MHKPRPEKTGRGFDKDITTALIIYNSIYLLLTNAVKFGTCRYCNIVLQHKLRSLMRKEKLQMRTYKCQFFLDNKGMRITEMVEAISSLDAKRIVEARYSGHTLSGWIVMPV